MKFLKNRWMHHAARVIALLASAQLAGPALAAFPDRPIRLVAPAPAGGSVDILARLVATRMSESIGQPVIVDNRSGGNSTIGTNAVVKAPPDGYTLLIHTNSILLMHYVYTKLPYDVFTDMAPVAQLALSRNLLVVPASASITSLADFIKFAKASSTANYGSSGSGTAANLYGELLNQQAGLSMTHVPYRGSGPLLTDVMGGQVQAAFVDLGTMKSQLSSPKTRVLAVTGPTRIPDLPDVPTFLELGYKGFEPEGWFGIFAPAKTPPDVLARLATEIEKALKTPDVQARILEMGLHPPGSDRNRFLATVKTDAAVWAKIAKDSGIKVDP